MDISTRDCPSMRLDGSRTVILRRVLASPYSSWRYAKCYCAVSGRASPGRHSAIPSIFLNACATPVDTYCSRGAVPCSREYDGERFAWRSTLASSPRVTGGFEADPASDVGFRSWPASWRVVLLPLPLSPNTNEVYRVAAWLRRRGVPIPRRTRCLAAQAAGAPRPCHSGIGRRTRSSGSYRPARQDRSGAWSGARIDRRVPGTVRAGQGGHDRRP